MTNAESVDKYRIVARHIRAMRHRATVGKTYTELVPLKYGKLATKYPWIYAYFLQCTVNEHGWYCV